MVKFVSPSFKAFLKTRAFMKTRADWEAAVQAQITPLGLSSSAVADWKLLRDMIITLAMLLEAIWLIFKGEVTDALENKQPGGLYWYKDVSKDYQHSDSLQVVNGVVGYAVIDPAKQIVTQVSAKEILGDVLALKVAKTNSGTGLNEPLSATELAGFRSYINARRLPGTRINAVSLSPDTVAYQIQVFHRAGFAPATLQTDCTAALNAMRASAPFDGLLWESDFVDVLKNVAGVAGVNVVSIAVTPSGGTTTLLQTSAELQAGYYVFSVGSSLLITAAP